MRRMRGKLWVAVACLGLVVGCKEANDQETAGFYPPIEPIEQVGQSGAAVGFATNGYVVEDGCGNPFVMRGINYPYAWYADKNLTQQFTAMKQLGANTIRVVLSTGGFRNSGGDYWPRSEPEDVATIIETCRSLQLVCMLEVQDTVGYLDQYQQGDAIPLEDAVDYWIELKDAGVLEPETESFILINIGNEPVGNGDGEDNSDWVRSTWITETKEAIQRMRTAEFEHMLVVDAPNWGQDWSGTMRDNAADVLSADTENNTVFSVHMYEVYESGTTIRDYVESYVDDGLPLVIGEFGLRHGSNNGLNGSTLKDNVDEASIMAIAEEYGIGYIGWSWCGNGSDLVYLDMTNNFDGGSLTEWGDIIVNNTNGLAATSELADISNFDGTCSGGDTYTLTLHKNGGGAGWIYTVDQEIYCNSATCTVAVESGATVDLKAFCTQPAGFDTARGGGWTEKQACDFSGGDGCSVTMNGPKTVGITCIECGIDVDDEGNATIICADQ